MLKDDALEGKVALVAGGSAGIGRAISEEFARLGAKVVVAARRHEMIADTVTGIVSAGGNAIAASIDLVDTTSIRSCVEEVYRASGRIDILVNSAGWGMGTRAVDITEDDWQKSLNVNLTGAFFLTQAVGRVMMRTGVPGSIVNVTASRGWNGSPGSAHIGAAKSAMISVTKSLAVEWAPFGIRVNCLAPGGFETKRQAMDIWASAGVRERIVENIPLRRIAEPVEAAWAIAYLASDFARYVTGEALTIDGGWMLNQFSYLED